MSRSLRAGVSVALVLLVTALPALGAGEKPATEKDKIEALIRHIGGLKDAKFVRNGREYGAETAARFLRGKWEAKEAQIKTAKDFIDKVASASSTTGKPYLIRLKDGKEIKSKEYLLAELAKLEKSPKKARRDDELLDFPPPKGEGGPGRWSMRTAPFPRVRRAVDQFKKVLPSALM